MKGAVLFQTAIGHGARWQASRAAFHSLKSVLALMTDLSIGSRLNARIRGQKDCGTLDTLQKTWRHSIFFSKLSFIFGYQDSIGR